MDVNKAKKLLQNKNNIGKIEAENKKYVKGKEQRKEKTMINAENIETVRERERERESYTLVTRVQFITCITHTHLI